MKNLVLAFILTFIISVVLSIVFIPVLKKLKAGQPILKYVEVHKNKGGTPTMGGLLFIIPSAVIYLILFGFNKNLAFISVTIGLSFMFVGFLDDFIKIKYRKNEGLKPYQKIFFQSAIAIFAGLFCYENGLTYFFIPYFKVSVDLGVLSVPVIAVIFIAITNCVNLTDGLDGLASSVIIPYLIIISLITYLEFYLAPTNVFNEYFSLIKLSVCLLGGVSAFLLFNVNKAKIFMGDTGSLSLGGFIGAISIFSSNGFFIPIVGIMFVLSGISVIVQVVWFKRTGKRVFLMAPLHHHFQLKGKSEAQISYYYGIITVFMGLIALLFLL